MEIKLEKETQDIIKRYEKGYAKFAAVQKDVYDNLEGMITAIQHGCGIDARKFIAEAKRKRKTQIGHTELMDDEEK